MISDECVRLHINFITRYVVSDSMDSMKIQGRLFACGRVCFLGVFSLIGSRWRTCDCDIPYVPVYVGCSGVLAPLCEERLKPFSEDLVLQCPDETGNCIWQHVVANISIPIERRFLATDNGNVNLIGNDVYSFGEFVVNTDDTSQCYEVCPAFTDSSKHYNLPWYNQFLYVIKLYKYIKTFQCDLSELLILWRMFW